MTIISGHQRRPDARNQEFKYSILDHTFLSSDWVNHAVLGQYPNINSYQHTSFIISSEAVIIFSEFQGSSKNHPYHNEWGFISLLSCKTRWPRGKDSSCSWWCKCQNYNAKLWRIGMMPTVACKRHNSCIINCGMQNLPSSFDGIKSTSWGRFCWQEYRVWTDSISVNCCSSFQVYTNKSPSFVIN